MKRYDWRTLLGVMLLFLSIAFYILHYALFKDTHHIFIFLVGDIAFVFIEVLLVTLIIHRVLDERDKRGRLEKLNMVIGAFFSEVGAPLLRKLADLDPDKENILKKLIVAGKWSDKALEQGSIFFKNYKYMLKDAVIDWEGLKRFLLEKRGFLLRLLENPTVLEHESFTDLLRAVFHLTEELGARDNLVDLSMPDRSHLEGDTRRFYMGLCEQWLDYMNYLKNNYPYLFSLAIRTNPFDNNASAELKNV